MSWTRAVVVLSAILLSISVRGADADVPMCTIRFSLADPVALSSLAWDADYSALQGTFASDTHAIRCVSLVPDVPAIATNGCDGAYEECQWGAGRVAHFLMTLPAGFAGPTPLLVCDFTTVDPPQIDQLGVVVTAATTDTSFTPANDLPRISASASCD